MDYTWRSVLAKIVHAVKGFKYSLPFLGLRLHFLPKVLKDNVIVLPVVGVVSQDLKFTI